MDGRKRTVQIKFRVTEAERDSLSCHFGSDKGRPGRYEDCLAAFQRLHSPPLHAEAVRRARERLFWRRPRHSGTAASKTDDGCPHL